VAEELEAPAQRQPRAQRRVAGVGGRGGASGRAGGTGGGASGRAGGTRGGAHGLDPGGAGTRGRPARDGDARGGDARRSDARAVALEALLRVEEGAYANLVLPGLLSRSSLSEPDRHLATELVYGTTRMRRACDWLVDRFVLREPDAPTRAVLRLGAYQLEFLRTPPHAAVSATVSLAPGNTRGFVNAVLRRVADAGHPGAPGASGESGESGESGASGSPRAPSLVGSSSPSAASPPWPSDAVRLSYPDWIVDRLEADLGTETALGALAAMDVAASPTARSDGYIQDMASQWVTAALDLGPGERIVDVCAAPGGKTTALAGRGAALVVAGDVRPARAALVADNATRLGARAVATIVADGTRPPIRPRSVDRVLVDAPCSGLGVLRRRPDARWRTRPSDVTQLASLQRRLLTSAAVLLRPGGTLIYSVCTLTAEETLDIDTWLAEEHPGLSCLEPPGEPWRSLGRGALLLPQAAGTDGMFLLMLRAG